MSMDDRPDQPKIPVKGRVEFLTKVYDRMTKGPWLPPLRSGSAQEKVPALKSDRQLP
jgi:hypothetical protein